MFQAFPYQAPPRFGHIAVGNHQKVYLWGGHAQKLTFSPNTKAATQSVDVYDLQTSTWKKEGCAGTVPLGPDGCAYAQDGDLLYVYGGWDGDQFYNTLHQLNLLTLEWREVRHKGGSAPSRKARAGMTKCGESLVLFGGFGIIATAQDPALPQQRRAHEIEEMTNELHLFSLSNSMWSQQETSHTPPPCSSFSFVHAGQGRVVKFGGRQPDGCTNAVHVLDLLTWDWTNVKSNDHSPSARGGHSTCSWAGNLMITGGRGNDLEVYSDAWVLNMETLEWTQPQVDFSDVILKRCCHTATVVMGPSNSTVVVIFGGMSKWKDNGILPTVAHLTVIDAGQLDHLKLMSNNGHKSSHRHHHHHHHHHHHSHAKTANLLSLTESNLESQPGDQPNSLEEREGLEQTTPLRTTGSKREQRAVNQSKQQQRRKRRHSHPIKSGIVPPQRRSVSHDVIGRSWMVGKEEVQLTGEQIGSLEKKGEREGGDSLQVGVFRDLRVAAHWIHSSKDCAQAMKDVDTFIQVHHPNIVQLIGFTINNGLIILSELIPTTLDVALRTDGGLPRTQRVDVGLDVARALNYLHLMKPHPLVHGGVSSVNIFLDPTQGNRWRAKLSCKPWLLHAVSHGDHQSDGATDPKEDLHRSPCSPECDVYSFGRVLVEMMASGCDRVVQGLADTKGHEGCVVGAEGGGGWPEMEDLAKRCMNQAPHDRPIVTSVIVCMGTMIK